MLLKMMFADINKLKQARSKLHQQIKRKCEFYDCRSKNSPVYFRLQIDTEVLG